MSDVAGMLACNPMDEPTVSKRARFLRHRTKPGRRDEVGALWNKHMAPGVDANDGTRSVHTFGLDPDRICAFQVYGSAGEADAFLETAAYLDDAREVAPLPGGPPEVEVLHPRWIKGSR